MVERVQIMGFSLLDYFQGCFPIKLIQESISGWHCTNDKINFYRQLRTIPSEISIHWNSANKGPLPFRIFHRPFKTIIYDFSSDWNITNEGISYTELFWTLIYESSIWKHIGNNRIFMWRTF